MLSPPDSGIVGGTSEDAPPISPAERGNRHDPGVAGEDLLIVVAFRTVEGKLEKTMLA